MTTSREAAAAKRRDVANAKARLQAAKNALHVATRKHEHAAIRVRVRPDSESLAKDERDACAARSDAMLEFVEASRNLAAAKGK